MDNMLGNVVASFDILASIKLFFDIFFSIFFGEWKMSKAFYYILRLPYKIYANLSTTMLVLVNIVALL